MENNNTLKSFSDREVVKNIFLCLLVPVLIHVWRLNEYIQGFVKLPVSVSTCFY